LQFPNLWFYVALPIGDNVLDKKITQTDVRKELRACAANAGSVRKLAIMMDLSHVYVANVIRGLREPGPSVCRYLGLRRVAEIYFERIR
jgi:hypothetical protein